LTWLDSLTTENREAFCRVLPQGGYSLLLGAGASADSRGPSGDLLPLSSTLSETLATKYDLPTDPNLASTYERAIRGGREAEIYGFLHRLMTGCKPAGWYARLVAVPWRRIWTLNIDDVVEQAFKTFRSSAAMSPKAVNWVDRYRDGDLVVHLHGTVASSAPSPLVFSLLEYMAARSIQRAWHPIFGDQWEETPFIAIGASLSAEYELAEVFRRRQPKSSVPSLYVTRTISDAMRADLAAWNLIPIETSAELFFKELNEELGKDLRRGARPWVSAGTNRASAIFSQQFRYLASDAPGPPDSSHDLYRGEAPTWSDIVTDLDAPQSWSSTLASKTISIATGPVSQAAVMALGPRFTGRSTGLLRVAAEVESASLKPLLFRSEEGLAVEATLSVLRDNSDVVLLFDGLADHLADLLRLLRLCVGEGIRCTVAAVERDVRASAVVGRLGPEFLSVENTVEILPLVPSGGSLRAKRSGSRLSRGDASAIVAKLDTKARLGTLEREDRGQQIRVFEENGLFNGMEIATLGRDFRQRIASFVSGIADLADRRTILAVSVIDNLGFGMPISMLKACSLNGAGISTVSSSIREMTLQRESELLARHRSLGLTAILEFMSADQIEDLLIDLLLYLAPYVTEATLKSGARKALIGKGLLGSRTTQHWVGINHLGSLFERIEDRYEWNSRYWEQRAIAAELNRDWERAASWASRACTMTPDDFRHTTYGDILVKWAIDRTDPGTDEFMTRLTLALSQFESARRARTSNPVPLLACFTSLTAVAGEFWKRGLPVPAEVGTAWNRWEGHFHSGGVRVDRPAQEQFDRLNADWLNYLVGRPGR
jgi:hypothetical protein